MRGGEQAGGREDAAEPGHDARHTLQPRQQQVGLGTGLLTCLITLNHLRIIILHSSVPPLSPLPAGVKLLSLEAWGEGAVLVRLENTAVAGRGQSVSLAQV